jgi:lipopolysaccharide transport system permease protein
MSPQEQIRLFTPDSEPASSPAQNSSSASTALPDEPLIKIRSKDSGRLPDFRELWAHHELCYFLIWRDLKVRYKQTVLGSAWAILQPVLMTLVFTIFLGKLVRVPSDGLPYALFAYAGLLPWMFLNNAVSGSSQSLINSAPLITKIYFPRLLVPLAIVAVRGVDFIIAAVILSALLLYYGITPGWSILVFPGLILELTLLALGLGLWSAAMNVRYRDVGTLLPVALQLWMFASPVVYPASIVPEKWRMLYALNPLTGIIEGIRASLFNGKFDLSSISVSLVVVLLILSYSSYAFRRAEESFADVV